MAAAFDSFSDKLAELTLGVLGTESSRRLSGLYAARSAMPDGDVYDRIRLTRYILTGSEEPPEVTEIRNFAGETVVAHVEEARGYDAIRREPREPDKFPFPSGDVLVLGPEVFASTIHGPQRDTVINWRGVNFVPQDPGIFAMTQEDRETLTGVVGPDPAFEVALKAAQDLEAPPPEDIPEREPAPSAGRLWTGRRGGSRAD